MPGEMADVSQEEMRYLMYEKKKLQKEDEYILFENNMKKAHEDIRCVVKIGLSQVSEYWHFPLHYFNSVVEGNEENMKLNTTCLNATCLGKEDIWNTLPLPTVHPVERRRSKKRSKAAMRTGTTSKWRTRLISR